LSAIGIWGGLRTNFTGMTELSIIELLIISAAILLLTFLVFALPGKRLPIPLCCVIGLAAILIALQILALSNEFQFGRSFDAITTAAELFSHLAYWMIIIECVRRVDTPPFRIAGIAFMAAATFSLLWEHLVRPLPLATSSLVMIVVYVLLTSAMLLSFVNGSLLRGTSQAVPLETREREEYLTFAQHWSLTPRETELFILLMQGYKRVDIGQRCGLSEGTVKTHITNIYKKLDIHSKRELHQVFEQSRLLTASQRTEGDE
jgi:DNA-binding CsgD family transcriptional regulator